MEYSYRRVKSQVFPLRRTSMVFRGGLDENPIFSLTADLSENNIQNLDQSNVSKSSKSRTQTNQSRVNKSKSSRPVIYQRTAEEVPRKPKCPMFVKKKSMNALRDKSSSGFFMDPDEYIKLLRKAQEPKKHPLMSKQKRRKKNRSELSLCNNEKVLEEDAYQLQKLITGGYCCEQQFMSLQKFNQSKDDFVILGEIYSKAKDIEKKNQIKKQTIKSRNIFSVVYLNQNLARMGRKETNEMFSRLKIVK